MELSKFYSDSLSKLKPLLPRGYQKQIATNLSGIEYWEVKKAFNGLLSDVNKLVKIFDEATRMVKENQLLKKRTQQQLDKLITKAKKAS